MKKKNIAKAAAAAFIAANITATVVPVYADESDDSDVTKDESVYTVLNADGSVNEITVSDQLHSENGFNDYDDKSDLKDVQNLKSEDPVKTSKDGFVWNSKDKDIYYQGTSTKDLPMDIKITYTMDGKEATAKSLLGKSGHIQIKIAVDNKQKQTFESNGKKYNLATPFVTVAGAMLDQDKFSNVKINEGTVTSDSSHNIAAAVMIPGLKDGLSSVMDSDIYSAISSYLIDDITIDADVTDFESPTIMLAAATSTDKLKDELGDVDIPDISSQLDQLQDATNQLIDGSQALYDGAVKLDDGTGTLLNGINALSSGANTLASGADKVSAGAATLQNGLGQLSGNSAAIRSAAQQVADGVLNTVNQQLSEQGLNQVTFDNFNKVLADDGYIHDTPQLEAAGRKGVKDAIESTGNQVSDSDVDTIVYYALTNPGISGSNTTEKITNAANELNTIQISIAPKALKAQQTLAGATSTDDLYNKALAVDGVKAIVDAQRKAAASDNTAATAYAQNTFNTAVNAAKDGATKAGGSLDDAIARGIVVSAFSENAKNPSDTNITNSINTKVTAYLTYAAKAKAGDSNAAAAYSALTQGYTNVAGNESTVETTIAKLYQQTVLKTPDEKVLGQIVQGIKGTGVSDDATAMTVIVYAGQNGVDLNTAGSELQKAQSAQAAQTNAAADVQNANGSIVLGTYYVLAEPSATAAVKGASNNSSALATLVKIKAFVTGINDYTAGVDSAYAGSKTLASGASQLASGASQLKNGISQLQAGAKTLKSGSDTLASGAKTLLDGLNQYNDEAISKLTNNEKITTLQDAADLFTVIEENADDYNNYSGISEGTDGSVKFVYKVEGEKEDKKSNEADDSTKKDNRSFWERVVDLFNFSDLF